MGMGKGYQLSEAFYPVVDVKGQDITLAVGQW